MEGGLPQLLDQVLSQQLERRMERIDDRLAPGIAVPDIEGREAGGGQSLEARRWPEQPVGHGEVYPCRPFPEDSSLQLSRSRVPALLAALALAVALSPRRAQDLASFEKHLTVRTLDNGLTLLDLRAARGSRGVVLHLRGRRCGARSAGITGLAHMFEHMAFKGTTRVGTTDWNAEKQALAAVDLAYHAYDTERRKPGGSDPPKLADLEKAFKDAQEAAGQLRGQERVRGDHRPRRRHRPERQHHLGRHAATTTRSPPTRSSCGRTSSPSASSTPCCASSTRSATW